MVIDEAGRGFALILLWDNKYRPINAQLNKNHPKL